MIDALKKKFPNIAGPHAQDICYATENRQTAVKNVAHGADLVLVVGIGPTARTRIVWSRYQRTWIRTLISLIVRMQSGRSGWTE